MITVFTPISGYVNAVLTPAMPLISRDLMLVPSSRTPKLSGVGEVVPHPTESVSWGQT